MIHVLLPDNVERPLPFYLAMEEYLAALDDRDFFFMWQVDPTVIIGRNQNLDTEVNLAYCRENGINVVRRKSGGGCVYADHDNIMFSYVTTSAEVSDTFSAYTSGVASMLQQLGVDAVAGGRNDIIVDGRKVSGNAFYRKGNRSIVHGTMLYNTDVEAMTRAITPTSGKLKSKGVESVRSRVANLSEFLFMSIDEFKDRAASIMCEGTMSLTREDVAEIDSIAAGYTTDSWLRGKSPKATVTIDHREEGVGEFHVSLEIKGGRIAGIDLQGDFFLLSDLDSSLLSHLAGAAYEHAALSRALENVKPGDVIAGMTSEKFINMLMSPKYGK